MISVETDNNSQYGHLRHTAPTVTQKLLAVSFFWSRWATTQKKAVLKREELKHLVPGSG